MVLKPHYLSHTWQSVRTRGFASRTWENYSALSQFTKLGSWRYSAMVT